MTLYEKYKRLFKWIAIKKFPKFPTEDVEQEMWEVFPKIYSKIDFDKCRTGTSYIHRSLLRHILTLNFNRWSLPYLNAETRRRNTAFNIIYSVYGDYIARIEAANQCTTQQALDYSAEFDDCEIDPLPAKAPTYEMDTKRIDKNILLNLINEITANDHEFREYFFNHRTVADISLTEKLSRFGCQLRIAAVLQRIRTILREKGYSIPHNFYPNSILGKKEPLSACLSD